MFFEIILHCVDAAGPGVLKMIEVIRKTFLYSPLYQFFSEVDSSTFFRCGLITCDLGLKVRCHGHCFRLVEVSDIFREDLDVI